MSQRPKPSPAAAPAAAGAAAADGSSPAERAERAMLSPRAAAALRPALSYGAAFQRLKELGIWSQGSNAASSNPEGSIVLGVAENRISADLVHSKIASLGPCPLDMMTYQPWRGTPELCAALKSALEATFMQGVDVHPSDLTCTAGAGAAIDMLFHCIAEEGDAALVPAPYYPAFDNDLSVRGGVAAVPVYLDSPSLSGSVGGGAGGSGSGGGGGSGGLAAQLDAAKAASEAAGRPVCALIVSNPSNPLGTVVPEAEVREMLAWCLERDVHYVSDEIYALSVFADGAEFVSAAAVAARPDVSAAPGGARARELVHVIFGASKDLCASGSRLGVLHSRNQALNEALTNLAYFAMPSASVQWQFARLLGDAAWLRGYVDENRRRLRRSYELLTGALDALPAAAAAANGGGPAVPYLPATAAMFLWVDLRSALNTPTWEEEAALWRRMVERKRLLLTPGGACHAAEPGFFRICWAWMPAEALPVAVRRIAEAVAEHRASGGGGGGGGGGG